MPKAHERKELARIARRQEDKQEATTTPAPTPYKHVKRPRIYRLEYRLKPEIWEKYANSRWFFADKEWRRYFFKYAKAKDRDAACKMLNQKDHLFEYRVEQTKTPPEGEYDN